MSTAPSRLRCSICTGLGFSPWRWDGLVSCEGCGHVQQSAEEPHANEASQEQYFDDEFVAQTDLFTRLHEALNNRRRLKELRAVLPTGRALEVGVGRGGLLLTLHRAGYRVEGLDISAALCAAIESRHGLTIHRGTLESAAGALPAGAFDLLVMCHVLEHVEMPIAALQAARQLLRPGGVLYVAVPNRLAWGARLPGWTGYQPYHVQYFSASSLHQAMEVAGFKVRSQVTVEPLTGWFNAIVGSLRSSRPTLVGRSDRATRRSKRGGAWLAYNTVRLGAGLAATPFRWLQGRLGRGEELVVMAWAPEGRP